MTNEEAKGRLESFIDTFNICKEHDNSLVDVSIGKEDIQAFTQAIKALKQQPCEDCISRQAVINAINQNCIYENEYNLTASHIKEMVQQLPSVTQKEKTGHLIDDGFASESNWIFDRKTYRCSSCKFPTYIKYDYCPNCGARMVNV